MSDMAHIMETQDPHELWLVDGENKFRISCDAYYWLFASNGAGLPPTHHITELLAENAKLRQLVQALADCRNTTCDDCVRWDYPEGGCSLDGVMRELGVEE